MSRVEVKLVNEINKVAVKFEKKFKDGGDAVRDIDGY